MHISGNRADQRLKEKSSEYIWCWIFQISLSPLPVNSKKFLEHQNMVCMAKMVKLFFFFASWDKLNQLHNGQFYVLPPDHFFFSFCREALSWMLFTMQATGHVLLGTSCYVQQLLDATEEQKEEAAPLCKLQSPPGWKMLRWTASLLQFRLCWFNCTRDTHYEQRWNEEGSLSHYSFLTWHCDDLRRYWDLENHLHFLSGHLLVCVCVCLAFAKSPTFLLDSS